MKVAILYWTITGTTKRLAEWIAAGIRAQGVGCEVLDLRETARGDIASFDALGVGSPVHYYGIPAPVREAVRAMGPLVGMPAFVFTLNGTHRGAGLNRLRGALTGAGGLEIGARAFRGESYYLGYLRRGYLFSPGHPTGSESDDARRFGEDLARALEAAEGEPSASDDGRGFASSPAISPSLSPESDPRTPPVYALERLLSGPFLARNVYSRFFRADPQLCVRCGTCAQSCPVGNITWNRGDLPAWGRNCILCLTCAQMCPTEAVRCPIDWAVFRPFLHYNVERSARDATIGHARVELRHGRIVRL